MTATKRKPAKKKRKAAPKPKSKAKPTKAKSSKARPQVDPGLSIAERFDLPSEDDGYFEFSIEWDGGHRDDSEDFD